MSGERDRRRSFYCPFIMSHGETEPCMELLVPELSSTIPDNVSVITTDTKRASKKVVWTVEVRSSGLEVMELMEQLLFLPTLQLA